MKYEAPELVALPSPSDAIQNGSKANSGLEPPKEIVAAYEDWEE